MSTSLEKNRIIVNRRISFDYLKYLQEWRRPDIFERKESWCPQDVISFVAIRGIDAFELLLAAQAAGFSAK